MLTNPFTGAELFCLYSMHYGGNSSERSLKEWDEIMGKNKKKAWNNLAEAINERMQAEAIQINRNGEVG